MSWPLLTSEVPWPFYRPDFRTEQNSTFKIENNYSLDKTINNCEKFLILNSQLIAQKINFLIKEKPISLPNFSKGLASDEDTEIIKQSRSGLDLRLKKLFKDLSIEEFNKKSFYFVRRNLIGTITQFSDNKYQIQLSTSSNQSKPDRNA